jgi:tetratricopeptide (TPR) repeat protein
VLYRSYLWAIGLPGLVFFLVHGRSLPVLVAVGIIGGSVLAWQALDRVVSMSTPEKAWTDAIRKLSSDPRAVGRWFPYLNRGAVYADQNLFDLAMVDFDQSSRLGDLGMGAANLGSILATKGRYREALAAFDRAEKEGYNLYNLPFQRGLALMALGNVKSAYVQFQKADAMSPPSPTRELALLHLGRAALQMQKPDDAIAALTRLLEIRPGDGEARYYLGMALLMKKDYEHALPPLDAVVNQAPTRRAYYARALANYGLGRRAQALSDIDNAIRLGNSDPHLQEWRTKILGLP